MAKLKQGSLGQYVERTMRLKGLSARDVSERSGGAITQAYVASLMLGTAGNPSVKKLVALARGLGEDEVELFRVASGPSSRPAEAGERIDASHTLIVLQLMQKVAASQELTEILHELVLLPEADLTFVLRSLRLLNEGKSSSGRKGGSSRGGQESTRRARKQATMRGNLVLQGASSVARSSGHQSGSQGSFYEEFGSELVTAFSKEPMRDDMWKKLIATADRLYYLRKMDVLEDVSDLLISVPFSREYQSIGLYYKAVCVGRQGMHAKARELLEPIIQDCPTLYRTRALLALGATYSCGDDFKSALSLYAEAEKRASGKLFDPFTVIQSRRQIAVLKSLEGDHRRALVDLERLFPLARRVRSWLPVTSFDVLNSYAVELMELGRLEEAKDVAGAVLASPFAYAYHEWHETGADIARKLQRASRSVVPVSQVKGGSKRGGEPHTMAMALSTPQLLSD